MFNVPNNMEAILDEENVNDNVCEVRSLRMEGIFENIFGFMYLTAVVIKTL